MTDLHLHIDAVDTLMFKDGRPFNQGDAGASEAVSVFPPYPPTLVGAIRAALWQGPLDGKWNKDLLGDGTNWQDTQNTLNPLSFCAPLLLKNGEPVFPVPLHILEGVRKDGSKHLTRLTPGVERKTDRGTVKIPVPKDPCLERVRHIEDRWVNYAGIQKILEGKTPDQKDLIDRSELWRTEPRVGIGIDRGNRITSDGQLYMASHVRMADDVVLYACLTGFNDSNFDTALRPLAGEHRMAEIKSGNKIELPKNIINDKQKHCLIALSPVIPSIDDHGKFSIVGLEADKVVSACLGKPVVIGGWDSVHKKPIPLRNCIPAGSVWFMDGKTKIPKAIGQSTQWGFGQVMIGKW